MRVFSFRVHGEHARHTRGSLTIYKSIDGNEIIASKVHILRRSYPRIEPWVWGDCRVDNDGLSYEVDVAQSFVHMSR